MRKPNRWTLKASVFLLFFFLASAQGIWAQAPVTPAKTPELYFNTLPSKQLFSVGENVVIVLELYSRSEQPILVSRLQGREFVSFKVIGPDGKEVPWQGEMQSTTKGYSPPDFTVLRQYKKISANRIISLKDGAGFAFDKPGQYSLTAEFTMGAPENFAAFADQTKPALGSFHSEKLAFCVEACILEPLPVRNTAPRSALDTVRLFYTYITRYQQLGIPSGRAKRVLWPLLSERLARQLDSLKACDEDYYRRYGEILRANTYKSATPWLEDGLFTGPNDAATPRKFSILDSRSVGDNRVDVHLRFPEPEYCCTQPTSYYYTEGDIIVIRENKRWVVDDYVAMYENDELERLSAGYPQCKAGQWVGEKPH